MPCTGDLVSAPSGWAQPSLAPWLTAGRPGLCEQQVPDTVVTQGATCSPQEAVSAAPALQDSHLTVRLRLAVCTPVTLSHLLARLP